MLHQDNMATISSLPPSVTDEVYGKFSISIIKVNSFIHDNQDYLKSGYVNQIEFQILFLGDTSGGIFLCPEIGRGKWKSKAILDIRTTPDVFIKYLEDMSVLKIFAIDIGINKHLGILSIPLVPLINKNFALNKYILIESDSNILIHPLNDMKETKGDVRIKINIHFTKLKPSVDNRIPNSLQIQPVPSKYNDVRYMINNKQQKSSILNPKIPYNKSHIKSKSNSPNKEIKQYEENPNQLHVLNQDIENILKRTNILKDKMGKAIIDETIDKDNAWKILHGEHPPVASDQYNINAIEFEGLENDLHPNSPATNQIIILEKRKNLHEQWNLSEANKVKLELIKIIVKIDTLRRKIQENNVFIECKIPAVSRFENDFHYIVTRTKCYSASPIITLTHSFEHPIEITKENQDSIQNSELIFEFIQQKGNDLPEILAKGILPFNKILLSENYLLETFVSMDSVVINEQNDLNQKEAKNVSSKISENRPKNKSIVKKAKVVNLFSKKPQKIEIQNQLDTTINTQMAELRVKINLVGDFQKFVNILPKQPIRQLVASNKPLYQRMASMLLYINIGKCKDINNRKNPNDVSNMIRNLYVAYKPFESNDKTSTNISWAVNNPDFNHSAKYPLIISQDALEKIKSYLFVFELWDKVSNQSNELLGIGKVPFSPFFHSIKVDDSFVLDHILNNVYPFILVDDFIAIRYFSNSLLVSFLKVCIAIGTPLQIKKIEDQHYESSQDANNEHKSSSKTDINLFDKAKTMIEDKDKSIPIEKYKPRTDIQDDKHTLNLSKTPDSKYVKNDKEIKNYFNERFEKIGRTDSKKITNLKSPPNNIVLNNISKNIKIEEGHKSIDEIGDIALLLNNQRSMEKTSNNNNDRKKDSHLKVLIDELKKDILDNIHQSQRKSKSLGISNLDLINIEKPIQLKEKIVNNNDLLNLHRNSEHINYNPEINLHKLSPGNLINNPSNFFNISNSDQHMSKFNIGKEGDRQSISDQIKQDRPSSNEITGNPLSIQNPLISNISENNQVPKKIDLQIENPIPNLSPPVDKKENFVEEKKSEQLPQINYKHIFTISVTEISSLPIIAKIVPKDPRQRTNIYLSYTFPLETTEVISSCLKKTDIPNKYSLLLKGTHSIVMSKFPLFKALEDEIVKFYIVQKKDLENLIIGIAQIPCDELLNLENQFSQDNKPKKIERTLFIYGTSNIEREACIIGKIKIKIKYNQVKENSQEIVTQKEIAYTRNIPINSMMVVYLKEIKDLIEGLSQLNENNAETIERKLISPLKKSNFFTVELHPFIEHSLLSRDFQRFSSHLIQIENQKMKVEDKFLIPIEMSPEILEFIQHNNLNFQIIKHDNKDNTKKKLIGTAYVPLIDLLINSENQLKDYQIINESYQTLGKLTLSINLIDKNQAILEEKIDETKIEPLSNKIIPDPFNVIPNENKIIYKEENKEIGNHYDVKKIETKPAKYDFLKFEIVIESGRKLSYFNTYCEIQNKFGNEFISDGSLISKKIFDNENPNYNHFCSIFIPIMNNNVEVLRNEGITILVSDANNHQLIGRCLVNLTLLFYAENIKFLENYFSIYSQINHSQVIGTLKISVNSFNNLYIYGMRALEKENCPKISNQYEKSNIIKIKNIISGKDEIIYDYTSLKARHHENMLNLDTITKMHKLKEFTTNKPDYNRYDPNPYYFKNNVSEEEEKEEINRFKNYYHLGYLPLEKKESPKKNIEDDFKRASSSPPAKYLNKEDYKNYSRELKLKGKEIYRTPNKKPPFPERLSEKIKSINLNDIKESEIQRITKIMKGSNKKQNYSISYSSESDNL